LIEGEGRGGILYPAFHDEEILVGGVNRITFPLLSGSLSKIGHFFAPDFPFANRYGGTGVLEQSLPSFPSRVER